MRKEGEEGRRQGAGKRRRMRVAAGRRGAVERAHARCGEAGGGACAVAASRSPLREPPPFCVCVPSPSSPFSAVMALVSADSRIAELLGELHQLIKQTQVSGWGRRLTRNGRFGGGGRHSTTAPPPLFSSSLPQEERSRSEHNLVNIQKTHERMQTENKSEGKAVEGHTHTHTGIYPPSPPALGFGGSCQSPP